MATRYTDNERTMIFVSVVASRRKKLSWTEAHSIAKKAGFRGGVSALQVFINNQRMKNEKAVREVNKKVRASMEPASPAGQIEAAVEKLVQNRVNVAIEKAIETLKGAL